MKKQMTVVVLFALAIALAVPVLAEGPDGKALYDAKCAACHGKDGVAKSMAKGSANFNDQAWQKANSSDAIAKVATDGKNKMPKFGEKLQPAEIKAVAEYIKTWEKK
jgi:mono/diheme cytochrome c family protein